MVDYWFITTKPYIFPRSVVIHHFRTLKKEALVLISVLRLCCGVVTDYRKVTGAETGTS
jgi:hypothetical protein